MDNKHWLCTEGGHKRLAKQIVNWLDHEIGKSGNFSREQMNWIKAQGLQHALRMVDHT